MTIAVVGATGLDGMPLSLRCEGSTIADVGPAVVPDPDDVVIDGSNMTILPPFVNGHTHAAMTLFRSYGDDLALIDWLQTKIWPAEAKLTADDVYWGTRLACIEMIRSGTGHFFDMYWHGTAVARAAEDAGVRATVSAVLLDGLDPSRAAQLRDSALESLDALGEFGDLISPSLGPHAIYTVSRPSLEWLAQMAADRDVAVHIHLSEIEKEVADCVAEHGVRPAALLDEVGMLSPTAVLAHGCWLDGDELALIAERRATVVTNPASNLKLASGTFPYVEAAAAGVPMGLGTDGVSSNNNLDLLEEVKLFSLVQKAAAKDPSVLPAPEALAIAQGLRSQLMAGSALERGNQADFILVRRDLPETCSGDTVADLVYAANGSAVDTTVIGGRLLMRDRRVADQEAVITEVRERAARLTS
jgi:5-methylthioadenosine/S-adenosylhomocysteine deaminase